MHRQLILDTETTGLDPAAGHRVIEIGCVELIDRKLTGNRFHVYLNPERDIDPGAVEVHGLSLAFLADKPRFKDIAQDFISFVEGAELIIHNAPFDVGFLDHELRLLDSGYNTVSGYCDVTDTLLLARKKHPGQRNSLDALCKRYGVDNKHRSLHGALLDAEILADVYLAMTGGQTLLMLDAIESAAVEDVATAPADLSVDSVGRVQRESLRVITCSDAELEAHQRLLENIQKASGGQCIWMLAGE